MRYKRTITSHSRCEKCGGDDYVTPTLNELYSLIKLHRKAYGIGHVFTTVRKYCDGRMIGVFNVPQDKVL